MKSDLTPLRLVPAGTSPAFVQLASQLKVSEEVLGTPAQVEARAAGGGFDLLLAESALVEPLLPGLFDALAAGRAGMLLLLAPAAEAPTPHPGLWASLPQAAVSAVVAGCLLKRLARGCRYQMETGPRRAGPGLTPFEWETLALMSLGMDVTAVRQATGRSAAAVYRSQSLLRRKLGVATNEHALIKGLSLGLVGLIRGEG